MKTLTYRGSKFRIDGNMVCIFNPFIGDWEPVRRALALRVLKAAA